MNNKIKASMVLLLVILFSVQTLALEGNRIVTNSENWEDVYSSMLYASLIGAQGNFLTSAEHGPLLLNGINPSQSIGIVTSDDRPFFFGYGNYVESRDYEEVEEIVVDSANVELIEEPELDNIDTYIIVGNSYGYSAVAVAPYAIKNKAWVFLADRTNIADIEAVLDRREVKQIIIYGYVEREVTDTLEKFNPETIDTGDRFQDNIEIVRRYIKQNPTTQILLSNGAFLESELMGGLHPIIFTGRDNVPDQIAEYLKESEISIGVLIGNELINAATNIRRSTGISVMVKFAQGARQRTAGVSAVEGLDLFYLPTPTLNLEIYSVKYNRASSKVEVTYHSSSNVPLYLKGTLTFKDEEGNQETTGDLDPIFLAPNDYKTIVYPEIILEGDKLTAELVTLFGEVATGLDYRLTASIDMGIVTIIDKCDAEPEYVKYNIQREKFVIGIKNKGEVDCYVDIELEDLRINRRKTTIGTEGSILLKAGKKEKIEINQRMTPEDLEDNPEVELVAFYGEREDALVNVFRRRFDLDIDKYSTVTYAIIIVIILLLILLILFFIVRRRKEDEDW